MGSYPVLTCLKWKMEAPEQFVGSAQKEQWIMSFQCYYY